MLASTALLIEYEAVLTRPAVLTLAGASIADVRAVLEGFADLCVLMAISYRWRPQARDPGDDLVLEAAINGGALVVASFNVRDMQDGARRFGITVERPDMVLRRIAG